MNELALFAGAGGGILGGKLLGWRTRCAVEIDAYARSVLLARQADGYLDPFPIWDDVTTFDGQPWRGHIDVVSGGFPCQDISSAGKGAGLDGARSGLWAEMARVISEVQPSYVWVENSPMLVTRGLERVLWDLAAMGYDARWGVFSAADAGAPHIRERLWILGHSMQGRCTPASIQPKQTIHRNGTKTLAGTGVRAPNAPLCTGWKTEPGLGRVVDGVAFGMDRIAAVGNGQVPAVVRLAWDALNSELLGGGV